jgi:hypothetical protein
VVRRLLVEALIGTMLGEVRDVGLEHFPRAPLAPLAA